MTTEFDRDLVGFRFVETLRGDSLQTIAARELGDASLWTDLIAYNSLVPPFITDDPLVAGPGVVLTGALILAPAPTPTVSSTLDPDAVFGIDIQVDGSGRLQVSGGDFAQIAGTKNLVQALQNRIETDRGELIYHTTFGCDVRRLLGTVNGPTATLLGAQYAKSAVLDDPRINRVLSSVAVSAGDGISVTLEAEVIAGRTVTVTATT